MLKFLPSLGGWMLEDGIYGLAYAVDGERMPTEGSALATLRKGRILGSDPWGGVFQGSCQFDAARRVNTVRLRLDVPPDGKLITGFSAGPAGASLDIVGAFERAAPKTATVVEVGGAAVRVELTYLGPLPA